MSDDAMGLTQRELLMEMREDIKGLKATVDAIAKDQALGVERRASMQRSADSIYARLDGHDRDVLGANDFTFTLTARAKAHGWDAAFGDGDQSISIGRSGRGERI